LADKRGHGKRDDPHGIGAAIKARGLSQRAAARLAGENVDFQAVQRLFYSTPSGKPTYSQYLPRILAALDIVGANEVVNADKPLNFKNDVPVYGLLPDDGHAGIAMSENVVAFEQRPHSLANSPHAFGVRMRGYFMAPLYRPADTLLVDSDLPPRVETGVILSNRERNRVFIGEFVSETNSEWIVKWFGNEPTSISVKKSQYPECHCVVAIYPAR
jgi:hypothetical protein